MSKDFGYRLQNYAYELISDDVAGEFQRNLNDWKIHTNNLVLYARKALARHQGHLEDIKKQLEAERAQRAQLAMFVLSLVSGPALSFVSGAIQYRLGPKLFGNRSSEIRKTPNPKYVRPEPPKPFPSGAGPAIKPELKRPPELPKAGNTVSVQQPKEPKFNQVEVFDPDWSKTKGKILGDLGSKLINDFMVSPALKAAAPNQSKLQNAIDRVPDSVDLDAMQTNLDNTWLEAQSAGKQAIQFFANTIREDSTWGDRFWEKAIKGQLAGVPKTGDDLARFNNGKTWIRAVVDQQRETWAKQDGWFYYGNAPAPITEAHTVNAIESEMWALWIALENFQPIRQIFERESANGRGGTHKYEEVVIWNGLSGRSNVPLDRVLPRLRELGVLEGAAWLEQSRRTKHIIETTGLLPVEMSDIYGAVDTSAELNSINNWATNRKSTIFGGRLGSVPRTMGSLVINGKY